MLPDLLRYFLPRASLVVRHCAIYQCASPVDIRDDVYRTRYIDSREEAVYGLLGKRIVCKMRTVAGQKGNSMRLIRDASDAISKNDISIAMHRREINACRKFE